MSGEELVEWMAYDQLEPIGGTRAEQLMNYRFAMLCSLIANCNRGPKQRAYKIDDFMIDTLKKFQEPTPIEQQQKSMDKVIRMTAPKGAITVYEGDAPPIKRIGKRARRSKKLDRILYGEPR